MDGGTITALGHSAVWKEGFVMAAQGGSCCAKSRCGCCSCVTGHPFTPEARGTAEANQIKQ